MSHDYCQGFEIVADIRKITAKTIKKINPMVLHKGLMLLTVSLKSFCFYLIIISIPTSIDILFT